MITFDIKKTTPELLLQAINHISKNQKCWIVGGFLRDIYWGRNVKDVDLVLEKNVLQIAESLKKEIFENDCSFEYFENFRTARFLRELEQYGGRQRRKRTRKKYRYRI